MENNLISETTTFFEEKEEDYYKSEKLDRCYRDD